MTKFSEGKKNNNKILPLSVCVSVRAECSGAACYHRSFNVAVIYNRVPNGGVRHVLSNYKLFFLDIL